MPESRKLTIATNHGGYAAERNITKLPFANVEVIRALNAFRVPNYLYFRLFNRLHPLLLNHEWDYGLGRQDILHLFNGINLGGGPWVCTFETFLPRWGAYGNGNLAWGIKQLAKTQCKALFALSACAADIQRGVLAKYPAYQDRILPKLHVQHPPQPLLLERPEDKAMPGNVIEMALTGADFFRKGGLQVLRVLDRMFARDVPFKLHIVSSMQTGDYASKAGQEELTEAMAIIARHPGRIVHYPGLPYHKVLELFRTVHLGLLPTWADTYGYTVLEAQAAACPVISTDVRALPEINNDEIGWVIPVRKDAAQNAILVTPEDRHRIASELEPQIEAIFESILADPEVLTRKGRLAWERIRQEHDPVATANRLEAKYREVLGWK